MALTQLASTAKESRSIAENSLQILIFARLIPTLGSFEAICLSVLEKAVKHEGSTWHDPLAAPW